MTFTAAKAPTQKEILTEILQRITVLERQRAKQDEQLDRLIFLQRRFLRRLVSPVRYPLTEYLDWRREQMAARFMSQPL